MPPQHSDSGLMLCSELSGRDEVLLSDLEGPGGSGESSRHSRLRPDVYDEGYDVLRTSLAGEVERELVGGSTAVWLNV
jgi:hypothetical protein